MVVGILYNVEARKEYIVLSCTPEYYVNQAQLETQFSLKITNLEQAAFGKLTATW